MFYLKAIFNIFRSHIVLLGFNVIALALFLTTINYRTDITNFFSLDNKTNRSPYFNALISGKKDISFIQRKMQQLPGVESVTIKDNVNAANELKKIIPKASISEALGVTTFTPVKIFLNANITTSSRKLIREYLTRLMGEDSVTFSRVKYPAKINLKKYPYFKIFSNWSGAYFAFIFFGLWITSVILIAPYFHQQGYIIEKFQRKKAVSVKMFAGLVFFVSALTMIIFLSKNSHSSVLDAAIIIGSIFASIFIFNFARHSSRRII